MNWIWDNKEWLFSGVGVTILGGFGLFKFFQKKDRPQQSQKQTQSQTVNVNLIASSNSQQTISQEYASNEEIKAKTHILFIDVERFSMINILRKAGWNVEYKKNSIDPSDKAVLSADIIFVDINGVASEIFRNQGLGLAAEIKKKHPEKKVVIYSAEPNGDRFDSDLRKVDSCLPKNAEPIEFINLIEEYTHL